MPTLIKRSPERPYLYKTVDFRAKTLTKNEEGHFKWFMCPL